MSLYLFAFFIDMLMGFWMEDNINMCAESAIFILKFMLIFPHLFIYLFPLNVRCICIFQL